MNSYIRFANAAAYTNAGAEIGLYVLSFDGICYAT